MKAYRIGNKRLRTTVLRGECYFAVEDLKTLLGDRWQDAAHLPPHFFGKMAESEGVRLLSLCGLLGVTFTMGSSSLQASVVRLLPRMLIDAGKVQPLPEPVKASPPPDPMRAHAERVQKEAISAVWYLRVLKEAENLGLVGPDYKDHVVADRLHGVKAALVYVSDFLHQKGLSSEEVRKRGPAFGKAVATAYTNKHGKPPGRGLQFVNGLERSVYVYTTDDLPLLEEAFDSATPENS